MPHVKTEISIEESLFREVDKLADEMNTSRSRLIEMAVSEFVHRQKSRKLLEEINEACDDTPDAMEGELRQAMKAKHRQLLEKEENYVDIKAMYKYLDDSIHAEVLDFPGVISCDADLEEARLLLAGALVDMADPCHCLTLILLILRLIWRNRSTCF